MPTFFDQPKAREIKDISQGEILIYGSSDGGTTWYPIKVSASGGLLLGGSARTYAKAAVNFATSGDNTIVAADGSNKIKIVFMFFTIAGETNLTFKSGVFSSGAMDFGGTSEPRGAIGTGADIVFETGVNEAFIINSSAAIQVSGWIMYYKEA